MQRPSSSPDHNSDANSLTFRTTSTDSKTSSYTTSYYNNSTSAKPHANTTTDPCSAAVAAVHLARLRLGRLLTLDDFTFLRRLGSGDIGTVYLAELKISPGVQFAAKVMDKEELAVRNKEGRAAVEKEILQMVDHPFLPRLYAAIDAPDWSCLVTEYCPGGDLHFLRQQQQPTKRFDEAAVRFYASEVVMALEYLHMVGVIYRDLNPTSTPQVVSMHHPESTSACRKSSTCSLRGTSFATAMYCFRPKPKRKGRKAMEVVTVTEPMELRSTSFVGTHEYLAPEIVCGQGHGNSVDWWTLGVFMYELFYGRTPFRGFENEMTLASIVARAVEFPKEVLSVPHTAKDLISRLLIKEPEKRMGATMGAAAVKQHPFFSGVNWALLRCTDAPFLPAAGAGVENKQKKCDSFDYY